MIEFEFSDVASGAATLIALFALGISLYELAENRPKLRISGDPAFVGDALQHRVFFVTITNYGRQPTTISGITFIPKRNAKVGPREGQLFLQPLWELSAKLPHVLEVGRTVTVAYSLDATVQNKGKQLRLKDLIVAKTFLVAVSSAWHSKKQMGQVHPGKLAEWAE